MMGKMDRLGQKRQWIQHEPAPFYTVKSLNDYFCAYVHIF